MKTDLSFSHLFHTTIVRDQIDLTSDEIDNIHRYVVYRLSCVNNESEKIENILDDEETKQLCPVLANLRPFFIKLFQSLLQAYQGDSASDFEIELGTQKISMLDNGHRSWIHSHVKIDAFAVMYLDDVQTEKGGELVLYDPKFHESVFNHGNHHIVQPRKGLVIAAPNYIWHEVNTYRGFQTRLALVVNAVAKQLR